MLNCMKKNTILEIKIPFRSHFLSIKVCTYRLFLEIFNKEFRDSS